MLGLRSVGLSFALILRAKARRRSSTESSERDDDESESSELDESTKPERSGDMMKCQPASRHVLRGGLNSKKLFNEDEGD
mmetsp:Transcript_18035/g.34453  ORF Transcript_18035/g.34453 Transcript_18035/m.34453 type:complete len:80 (-) Transcript_18035:145-384(-)